MRRLGLAAGFLLLASAPAGAGGDATGNTAPVTAPNAAALDRALDAYGDEAGFIAASVPLCGGDAEEVRFFLEQVRGLLTKAGGGAAEWRVVQAAAERSQATAAPSPLVCEEEIGRKHAESLVKRLGTIRELLKP